MLTGDAQLWVKLKNADEGEVDISELFSERMTSFTFTDREMGLSLAVISLRNDDFKLSDEFALIPGQLLQLKWGWPNDMSPIRNMIVKKLRGTNPREVVCFSEETLMDEPERNKTWKKKPDIEIVREIAERNKNAVNQEYKDMFLHIVDTPMIRVKHKQTTQKTTDARMLVKLAKRNAYLFWIDEIGLHFEPRPMDDKPIKRFVYFTDPGRGDILSQPDISENFAQDVNLVTVHARDPDTKKWVSAAWGAQKSDFTSLGDVEIVGDPFDLDGEREPRVTKTVVRNAGLMTQDEAEAEAERRYKMIVQERYTMNVRCIGSPRVRARHLIDMQGIGAMHSGIWYIKECETILRDGLIRQELSCIRDAAGKVQVAKKKKITRKKNKNEADSKKEKQKLYAFETVAPDGNGRWRKVTRYHSDKQGWKLVDTPDNATLQNADVVAEKLNSMTPSEAERRASEFNAMRN